MSEIANPARQSLTLEQLRTHRGATQWVSEWLRIDQRLIDDFARVTGDDAFIHVDPIQAAKTRFGGTIAHGLLTLSLLPRLLRSATPIISGTRMGVNYGFDRVRFLAPVPVDADVRASFTLTELEERDGGFVRLVYDVIVSIQGTEKPAATVRWVLGRWLGKQPDS